MKLTGILAILAVALSFVFAAPAMADGYGHSHGGYYGRSHHRAAPQQQRHYYAPRGKPDLYADMARYDRRYFSPNYVTPMPGLRVTVVRRCYCAPVQNASPQASAPAMTSEQAETELRRLKKMLDDKILTPEEYTKKRAPLVARL